MSGGFLSELRYERIGNRFRQERLERSEFRSLLLAAHCRPLSQLVAEGQITAPW